MLAAYADENVEIQMLTQEYVTKLTKIWLRIFDQDTCRDNLAKLMEHIKGFYEELVTESLEKQEYIKAEINNLQEEAVTLRRLLNTKVELIYPKDKRTPLIIIQVQMDQSLTELRECLRLRREEICELLLQQEALCEELDEPPLELLADPLPTATEIDEFREYLQRLRREREQRTNQLSKMRREIKNCLETLELQVSTDTEDRLLNQRQLKLSKENFVELQRMHDRCRLQEQQLHEKIDSMRQKLDTLWKRLNTSPESRLKLNGYTAYTQYTHNMLYEELQRCEELRSQNIKFYVQQIRREIEQWWDKTLKSEIERSRFTNFHSNCYTDDLLALHDLELDDLKFHYDSNRQIFELYAERAMLWERMSAVDTNPSDPKRYNNRGGNLLREERERKTIAKKLPQIEAQITELVHAYVQSEKTPFLVYGENILDVMARDWEQRHDKQKINSARKLSKTLLPSSQLGSMRTPMSLKNTSTITSLYRVKTVNNLRIELSSANTQNRNPQPPPKQQTTSTPLAKVDPLTRTLALNNCKVFLKPSAVTLIKDGRIKAAAYGGNGGHIIKQRQPNENVCPTERFKSRIAVPISSANSTPSSIYRRRPNSKQLPWV